MINLKGAVDSFNVHTKISFSGFTITAAVSESFVPILHVCALSGLPLLILEALGALIDPRTVHFCG